MKLDEFAQTILFGKSLADKLISTELCLSSERTESEVSRFREPIDVPAFPGRIPELSRIGKAAFPSVHRLDESIERAKVLHFFANHELLALELMALALLRFPNANPSFRNGIARIMQEEQEHLRLYLSRMSELGIQFGDLPVNTYFWNTLKGMQSPLDFTVQMSLTFEQANLDFSLFFMNAIQKTGDALTSALLERVFREEIGHVKHGLVWFNRWRSPNESDWDSYVKLLPFPLTPQRAKGFEFSSEARRQAGFSETYIRELKVYSGSKGRPPLLWYYNPHCDSEIARGRPGFTPSEGARELSTDLEHIPMFLCQKQDIVLVQSKPRTEWLEALQNCGFPSPHFVESKDRTLVEAVPAPKVGGFEPWGWSPEVFHSFQPLRSRLVEVSGGNSDFCNKLLALNHFDESGIGKFFSKSWSAQYLLDWLLTRPEMHEFFGNPSQVGSSFSDWRTAQQSIQAILTRGYPVMAKAPFGTSGRQVRKISKMEELSGPLEGWIKNTIQKQKEIVVEPYLDKVFDISMQMEIQTNRVLLFEPRPFMIGPKNEYRGTYLGKYPPEFTPEYIRFFHSIRKHWQDLVRDLGTKLRSEGYLGPAGVDAFLWKDPSGKLFLKPLVELNPRWTMGRVALEIEKHLSPRSSGIWSFLPIREILIRGFSSADAFALEMEKKHPLILTRSGEKVRIQSGVVFTNDPSSAKSILTLLQVQHS